MTLTEEQLNKVREELYLAIRHPNQDVRLQWLLEGTLLYNQLTNKEQSDTIHGYLEELYAKSI